MSVKYDIYSSIKTAIKSYNTDIKDVHIWNNQLDNEDKEKSDAYPMVFVEFSNIVWDRTSIKPERLSSVGNATNQQKGDFIITLHIAFWKLEDETESFQDIDNTIEQIYFIVMGLKGTYFHHLLRVSEKQDTNHESIIDWQISFSSAVEQPSMADENLILIPADTLSITANREIQIDDDNIRAGKE